MRPRQSNRIDLTEGAIAPKVLKLAAPLVAGNILQTVYNLVDVYWVGKLGATAVAAVSIVFPMAWLLISLAMGVTIAGAALVAQWSGAGKPERAAFAAAQMLVLSIVVATVLSTVAYLGRFRLLDFLGAKDELFAPTLAYLSVIFWSVPFTFGFFSYQSALRGVGDTMRPMYLVIATNILNMVLDPLLIFGVGPFPEMGVAGAAWATLLSRALAALIGIWYLFYGNGALTLKAHQLKPDWPTQWQILRVGTPGGLDGFARSSSAVVLVALITPWGAVATAAYGIGIRVMSMVWTVAGAIGQGAAVGVGQNLGALQSQRATRVAWTATWGALALVGLAGLASVLFAVPIVDIFVDDPAVIAEGASFLRITGWGFGLGGALMVISGAFQGAGSTGTSMLLALINRWALRVPLAALLAWPLGMGVTGIWWAYLIAEIGGFALGAAWMRWGSWQKNLVQPT